MPQCINETQQDSREGDSKWVQKSRLRFGKRKMTFSDPVTQYPIMAILDPSHLVKLIRNSFQVPLKSNFDINILVIFTL